MCFSFSLCMSVGLYMSLSQCVCVSLSMCVSVSVYVYVSQRVCLCVILWTVARQAPLSVGFSRQEYWSGLLCPPPGDLPDPRIKPMSLASPALAGGFFTTRATWGALELL